MLCRQAGPNCLLTVSDLLWNRSGLVVFVRHGFQACDSHSHRWVSAEQASEDPLLMREVSTKWVGYTEMGRATLDGFGWCSRIFDGSAVPRPEPRGCV